MGSIPRRDCDTDSELFRFMGTDRRPSFTDYHHTVSEKTFRGGDMKKLFILILILFPLLVHGENLKLSELTAVTSAGVESEDLLLVTINPTDPVAESDGGTRASRKVTLGNLLLWIAAQTVSVGGTWTMTTPVLDTPTITLADDSTSIVDTEEGIICPFADNSNCS